MCLFVTPSVDVLHVQDTTVKLNVAGVLEDFRILGGAIVRSVETL